MTKSDIIMSNQERAKKAIEEAKACLFYLAAEKGLDDHLMEASKALNLALAQIDSIG